MPSSAEQRPDPESGYAVGETKTWITSFIDIQGWGTRLSHLDAGISEEGASQDSHIREATPAVTQLLDFRSVIDKLGKIIRSQKLPNDMTFKAAYGKGPDQTPSEFFRERYVAQWFTDCLYSSFAVDNFERTSEYLSFIPALLSTGAFFLEGLVNRVPLRGGMDYGLGWLVSKGDAREVVGASLGGAYKAEQDAGHLRVRVTTRLADLLQRPFISEDGTPWRGKTLSDFLLQDGESWSLHYLHPGCIWAVSTLYPDCVQRARRFLTDEHAHLIAIGDTKIAPRYEGALRYFAEYAENPRPIRHAGASGG